MSNLEVEDSVPDRRFVGLANQGSTCYMNSLLQTLFMTPEFRRHLYMWRYNPQLHGKAEDCIPYQLQLLFSKLQLSQAYALETTGLTTSFQWDARESFEQHDVQEFCRVLFDAIEQSVKHTLQERMISELFEGVLMDYVKCEKCGHESSREDKYLDISLAVKNDFDHIYNDSVEKALANYVNVEHLTGDNAYFCEVCQSRQDAKKGLKFKSFPTILMLQLKRFDLNYETMQRVKINDKVAFPYVLNLNPFINMTFAQTPEPPPEPQDKKTAKFDPFEDIRPEDLEDRKMVYCRTSGYENIDHDYDFNLLQMDYPAKKAHMDRKAAENRLKRQQDFQRFRQEGENVYELFSVLIHAGSAWGGHYYAYIKSFAHDRWFCFNDSSVSEIDEKDIEKAFGGMKKQWGSSACAYLLVYRKIGPENVNVIDGSEVPDYIMDEIFQERQREAQERKDQEERKRILTIKVCYRGGDRLIDIEKSATLDDLKAIAVAKFELDAIAPADVRLRGYDIYQDTFQETYTGQETHTLERLGLYNYKQLVLEVKASPEVFEDYVPGGISLKICLWTPDIETQVHVTLAKKTIGAVRLQMNRDDTLLVLMQKIESKCGIPVSRQRILRKGLSLGHSEKISRKADYPRTVLALKIYEGVSLYVEDKEEHLVSKWRQEFDRELFRYVIKYNYIDAPATDFAEYPNTAVIDSREPVRKLKEFISSQINVPMDEFILKRGSKQSSEIKELSQKVSQSGLYNGGVVFIERGTPSRPDEYRISIKYVEAARDASDSVLFHFSDLVEMPLSINDTCERARELICEKVNAMYPSMHLSLQRLCLRERTNDVPTRVLDNEKSLSHCSLYENKPLCVQEVPEDFKVMSDDIAIILRQWKPSSWVLTDPQELFISKYASFDELGKRCAELYDIPEEEVRLTKIMSAWNFTRDRLPTEQWYYLCGSRNHLFSNPWYLSYDGVLMM